MRKDELKEMTNDQLFDELEAVYQRQKALEDQESEIRKSINEVKAEAKYIISILEKQAAKIVGKKLKEFSEATVKSLRIYNDTLWIKVKESAGDYAINLSPDVTYEDVLTGKFELIGKDPLKSFFCNLRIEPLTIGREVLRDL